MGILNQTTDSSVTLRFSKPLMSGSDLPTVSPQSLAKSSLSSHQQQFRVQFWGVRGGVPTPGVETVRFGGNTPCVEIQVSNKRIIFDGGTGLRVLGKHLCKEMPVEAHLFFTHTHWDRIQGFPFFAPAFIEGNCFHIYGAMGANGASIKQRLCDQMLRPNFPIPLQMMRADLKFHDISPGSVITLDDVMIETVSLNRPNGALGYRVTWNGNSVVYATDTEHSADHPDQSLLYLADQANLLIYDVACVDAAYCDLGGASEQHAHLWQSAVEVAITAQVEQVVLFHHDPSHEDDYLHQVEQQIQAKYSNVSLAREGLVMEILPR